MKKTIQRPLLLTIWLILTSLGSIYTLYSYTLGAGNTSHLLYNFPVWGYILIDLAALFQLIAYLLLWKYKKVGFFLLFAVGIISIVVNGMLTIANVISIAALMVSIVGVAINLGIFWFLLRPAWKQYR